MSRSTHNQKKEKKRKKRNWVHRGGKKRKKMSSIEMQEGTEYCVLVEIMLNRFIPDSCEWLSPSHISTVNHLKQDLC